MNHIEAVEKAVMFMEANLREDIRSVQIAEAAGYSYYHFHRLFEAITGETTTSYLRVRRLAKAAEKLVYTEERILDIALEFQFESQETFTRAFRKYFGKTPGSYRRNRILTFIGNKKILDNERISHLQDGMTIRPRIIETETVKLIGIRRETTLKNNIIPEMWTEINSRYEEIQNRTKITRGFGVCEVREGVEQMGVDENTVFDEFVGFEVENYEVVPKAMIKKELKGGKYAVFTHIGALSRLQKTYDYIWGTWVPSAGCELDFRDDYEIYDERFKGRMNEDSEFDIYIPIK